MDHDAAVLWIIAGTALVCEAALLLGASLVRLRKGAGIPMLTSDDLARRRSAKRLNERLKLFATFLNGIGVTFLITVAVTPALQHEDEPIWSPRALIGVVIAFCLHLIGQGVLTYWKSED